MELHCVFESSFARKSMRADDEKQEIKLLWPNIDFSNTVNSQ